MKPPLPSTKRFQLLWLAAGFAILAFYFVSVVPQSIGVIREPHRWHGFEVILCRWWLYAGPVITLIGATMIWKGSRRG